MVMKNNILNTDNDLYLIQFQNSKKNQFICEWSEIQEPLKLIREGQILEDIFRYNPTERKFKRVPKKKYKLLFDMNTEAAILLNL